MLSRSLYSCYTFQNVSSSINSKKLKKICESNKFIIYRYKENESSEEYIIGNKKSSPSKYFKCGDSFDLVCLFNDCLFLCNETGEIGSESGLTRTYIYRLDLTKKIEEIYHLRSNFGKMVFKNGYGRFYTTENYLDMNVINNVLVISGHREKSNEDDFKFNPDNKETDFEIVFECNDNNYIPYYKEGDKVYPYKNDIIVSRGKPDKSDDPVRGLAIFLGCFVALICAIGGIIGCIITHFKMPVWIGILIVGIIVFVVLLRQVIKKVS